MYPKFQSCEETESNRRFEFDGGTIMNKKKKITILVSVFNADSKKRQEQNFMAAAKLAQQAKARYEAYIGYCYGKKKDSGRGKPKMYQELAGKQFWTELTGDEEFYITVRFDFEMFFKDRCLAGKRVFVFTNRKK